jgi:hypothetical protein
MCTTWLCVRNLGTCAAQGHRMAWGRVLKCDLGYVYGLGMDRQILPRHTWQKFDFPGDVEAV